MLNIIWAVMILVGVLYAGFTGHMAEVTNQALASTRDAVELCITMAGVMALWMGLMEIADKAGIVAKMTRGIGPFLHFLFPNIPKEHPARGYIATNIIANMLGLGWACTPAGLKAMGALANLEKERGTYREGVASNEMCNFLIFNISSLELIPVNMVSYRSQYGSENPAGILAPAFLATLVSSVAAVCFIKWKDRCRRKEVQG